MEIAGRIQEILTLHAGDTLCCNGIMGIHLRRSFQNLPGTVCQQSFLQLDRCALFGKLFGNRIFCHVVGIADTIFAGIFDGVAHIDVVVTSLQDIG